MSTRTVVSVFLFAAMLGGCAQDLSKESSLPSALKGESVAVNDAIQGQGQAVVINQLMAESGMDDVIAHLPEMVAMGFDQQPAPPIGLMKYDAFRTNLLRAFESEKVRQIVVDHLGDHYEPERFAKFLAMIKTPLAKKMTALEVTANTPQAQQEMMQMGNIIMGQATLERLALIRRLDEAMKATELGVDMQMMMARVSMTNMNKIVPVAQRMSDGQLEQMLAQMRAQSLYPARQYTQLSLIYAFRPASDEELEAYILLHESGTGRGLSQLIGDAWISVSERVAADLASMMNNAYIENNAL